MAKSKKPAKWTQRRYVEVAENVRELAKLIARVAAPAKTFTRSITGIKLNDDGSFVVFYKKEREPVS